MAQSASKSNDMQLDFYYGNRPISTDLRGYSFSASNPQLQPYPNHLPNNSKVKKSKTTSGSSSSSVWSFSDPEFQRKKRVASYRVYTVEGKVKGSFKRSFRWLKDRCSRIVHGWW